MPKRKTICFVTVAPDSIHSQRISRGIFTQCEKYGYNTALFASMINPEFYYKDYAHGECNIYELPRFDRFDGVILDAVSLIYSNTYTLLDDLYGRIKEAGIPAVSISIPYKDLHTVNNNNEPMLRELCRHAIEVHGCKDICLLTGQKDNYEAQQRLAVFIDEIEKHGLTVKEEHKIFGNFWYESGNKLAQDIFEGRISKPDAVIAASDHMALGFIEEYTKLGGKIPEDICVLGFEATVEAALDDITLTTIESNFAKCAADAVNHIRSIIEPDAEIMPFERSISTMMHTGDSCGCPPDVKHTMKTLHSLIYYTARNYTEDVFNDNIDIGLLMENYIPEQLAASETPEDCIENISKATYIIMPFARFFLCLRDDWLNSDSDITEGYPDKMRRMIMRSNIDSNNYSKISESVLFDTDDMLPEMFDDFDEPYAYYFAAVHFSDKTLGYAVLQRKLRDFGKYNLVYRNWLRFLNNALEMARTKNRFVLLSIQDKMTGLLNRRGMYEQLDTLKSSLDSSKEVFACVIDMDGLKYINDTFGHSEGDYGIKRVGEAALAITQEGDICARAGGDEFYIAGLRDKGSFDADETTKLFCKKLSQLTKDDDKPFLVTASIGCAVCSGGDDFDFEALLSEADENMYRYKIMRKKQRK